MGFYDYEQVPLAVADAAFADFVAQPEGKSILDLLTVLIDHCDAWCAGHGAFSEQDGRVAVLLKLQAYLHEAYGGELTRLMQANIRRYQERQAIMARLHERRN